MATVNRAWASFKGGYAARLSEIICIHTVGDGQGTRVTLNCGITFDVQEAFADVEKVILDAQPRE